MDRAQWVAFLALLLVVVADKEKAGATAAAELARRRDEPLRTGPSSHHREEMTQGARDYSKNGTEFLDSLVVVTSWMHYMEIIR